MTNLNILTKFEIENEKYSSEFQMTDCRKSLNAMAEYSCFLVSDKRAMLRFTAYYRV